MLKINETKISMWLNSFYNMFFFSTWCNETINIHRAKLYFSHWKADQEHTFIIIHNNLVFIFSQNVTFSEIFIIMFWSMKCNFMKQEQINIFYNIIILSCLNCMKFLRWNKVSLLPSSSITALYFYSISSIFFLVDYLTWHPWYYTDMWYKYTSTVIQLLYKRIKQLISVQKL